METGQYYILRTGRRWSWNFALRRWAGESDLYAVKIAGIGHFAK